MRITRAVALLSFLTAVFFSEVVFPDRGYLLVSNFFTILFFASLFALPFENRFFRKPRSKRSGLLIGLGVPAVLFLLAFFTLAGNPLSEATLTSVSYKNTPTGNGYLTVSFNRDNTDHSLINVAVDFNNDGKFGTYKNGKIEQSEWVVKNTELDVREDAPLSFTIPLSDALIGERTDIKAVALLTSKEIESWDGLSSSGGYLKELVIGKVEKEDFGDRFKESKNPKAFGIGIVEEASAASHSAFSTGFPDLNQGLNECVPTSIANNIIGLAIKNGVRDQLPSDQEIITELKKDLKWTARDGVLSDNIAQGINKFSNRHGVAISYTNVVNPVGKNYPDQLIASLKAGEGAVLAMRYYDDKGRQLGGHLVTLVGIKRRLDGTYLLYMNDPLSGSGGTDVYLLDGTKIVNYRYRSFLGTAQVVFGASVLLNTSDDSSLTLCNGQYWSPCSSGDKLVCPPNGDAYCVDPSLTLCNGEYYDPSCPSGQKFNCPKTGGAQCITEQAPTPSGTLCNGKYWNPSCSSGRKFYCPPSGDAQCIIEQTPSLGFSGRWSGTYSTSCVSGNWTADIVENNGTVSGTFSEDKGFFVNAPISGTYHDGVAELSISGGEFSAVLSGAVSGSSFSGTVSSQCIQYVPGQGIQYFPSSGTFSGSK